MVEEPGTGFAEVGSRRTYPCVAVVAVVFLAIYLAVNPETYVSGTLKLVPIGNRDAVQRFIERLGAKLRGWLVGTILVSALVGVGAGVGLWLIGVPLALTFGILAAVLNVIPYLGSIVAGALPALVALTVSPAAAILVVVLFLALNQIEGNILRPVILGDQIEVPPAVVLGSILLLGSLLGIVIGALLAVPAAVLVKVLVDELTERKPELGDAEEGQRSEEGKSGKEERSSSSSPR